MTTYIASTSGGEIDGGSGNDVMIGKSGDDTFDGGAGSDILLGGAGNDFIYYDEFDIKVDGGTGYDTLVFNGTGQTLNLGLQKTVMNFEKIELSGGGGHSLTFSAADVLRTSDLDSLLIRGTNSSSVNFADSGWIFQGYSGGQARFANGSALVMIDSAVNVVGFSGNAMLSLASGSITSVTEDLNPDSQNMLVATGTILVSDPNAGQALLLPTVTKSGTPLGTLTLGANADTGLPDGSYTYKISNTAAQILSANKSWTDTFIVTSVDGSTITLDFKVNGADDPASIGMPTNASVKEDTNINTDGKLEAVGTIAISDIDELEERFDVTKTNGTGQWGTLLLDPEGNYTYSVNNASVNGLAENEIKTDTFRLYAVDGKFADISFTVYGSNDAPVRLFDHPQGTGVPELPDNNPNENAITHLYVGTFTIRDVDSLDAIYGWISSPADQLGKLDITQISGPNHDGDRYVNWQYEINDADMDRLSQALYPEKYTIHLSDRAQGTEGATIVLVSVEMGLIGSNDAPVLDASRPASTSGLVTELASTDPNAGNHVHQVSGSFYVLDVDRDDVLQISNLSHTSTNSTKYGNLEIDIADTADTSGSRKVTWTYSVSEETLDPLPAGSGPTEFFAITLSDGRTSVVQNVSIELTGAADGPIFSGDLIKTVTEFADSSVFENTGLHTTSGTIQVSNLPAGSLKSNVVISTETLAFGSFSSSISPIDSEGNATIQWTYTVADCLLDFLDPGIVRQDAVKLAISHSTDASINQSVSITLEGAKDEATDPKVAFFGTYNDDVFIIPADGPFQAYGAAGIDRLTATGSKIQALFGGTGDDVLLWRYGDLLSIGGTGDDIFKIESDVGTAFFWGQEGADRFDIFFTPHSTTQWVMDFKLGEDRINVGPSSFSSYSMTKHLTTTTDSASVDYNPFVAEGTPYFLLQGRNFFGDFVELNLIGSPLAASDLSNMLTYQ